MQIFNKISDKIRHIQSRPEDVKNRYIWTVVLAIFILIVVLWLVFPRSSVSSTENGLGSLMPRIKSDIREKMKSSFGDLKNNVFPELKKMPGEEGKADGVQAASSPIPN